MARPRARPEGVIAGRGPTLFSGLAASPRMKLLDTRRFPFGVVALHYRRR